MPASHFCFRCLRALPLAAAVFALVLTGACGDDGEATGRLDLELSGGISGVDTRAARVEIAGFTVGHTDGRRIQVGFDEPRQVDLTKLDGGTATSLVSGHELPAGRYEWLDLHVNARGREDTYLVLADESVRELVNANADDNPLRLETPFRIPAGGLARQTVDFHLHEPLDRKGPTERTYALQPLLRMVATERAAHITASAARAPIGRHCTEPHHTGLALYVFAGTGVTPGDIGGPGHQPIAVAGASASEDSDPYGFRVSFLAPGDYTLALTCNSRADRVGRDDRLAFFATTELQLPAGETTSPRLGPAIDQEQETLEKG